MTHDRTVLATGLGYLDAARWHRGRLWFSDLQSRNVMSLERDGSLRTVAHVPTGPSGLAFAPDDSVWVVSQQDETVRQLCDDGTSEIVATLRGLTIRANDMVMDRSGRAYISHFGFDWLGGAPVTPTGLVVRHPDGRLERCGNGLEFPNGLALSADERTLYVAESFGSPRSRLTAFDVMLDGTLTGQRVIKELGPTMTHGVDGICVDVEDGTWVALCAQGEYWRVLPDGTVSDVIRIPPVGGNYVVDSALGGDDLRTLYLLVADTSVDRLQRGCPAVARVEAVRVDVPGIATD